MESEGGTAGRGVGLNPNSGFVRGRSGKARLKRKTSKKRLRRALVEANQWLRQERNARKLPDLWQAISRKMRGHFNYFGVTDNSPALYRFERGVQRLVFKGYAQSSCKKLQARQERCPEIASFRVFGHNISPTVFFVHDFDHFYRFKMAHLSIDGKGMIFVQHGYTTSTSLSSICFCCYSLWSFLPVK